MDHQKENQKAKVRNSPRRSSTLAKLGDAWEEIHLDHEVPCLICHKSIPIDDPIYWNKYTKDTYHKMCMVHMISGTMKYRPGAK